VLLSCEIASHGRAPDATAAMWGRWERFSGRGARRGRQRGRGRGARRAARR